ncbi:hypothetical protein [Nocardia aurea]|uniref:hypothetical protein n=1 Tax=Nocardia aurea TaxID=2144174 RepID=UPI0033A0F09D
MFTPAAGMRGEGPDILILDEATASLDLATEAKVRAAVDVLTAGRTTIVVAHRLATAANADLVAVVGAGGLLQVGTHTALLAEEGPYRDLWAAYVGDGADPVAADDAQPTEPVRAPQTAT